VLEYSSIVDEVEVVADSDPSATGDYFFGIMYTAGPGNPAGYPGLLLPKSGRFPTTVSVGSVCV
jgi:hypothetical protein